MAPVTTASFSPSGADTFESFSPNSWTACLRRSSATSREPSGWTGPTENTNDSCPPPQHAGHSRLSASFPWCGGQSSSQSRCKRFRGSDQPPPPRPTPTKGASSSTRDSVQSSVPSLVSPPPPVTAVFVSRAAPNSKSGRSAGSSLLSRSVLKRPASSSTLSASTGSVCLFTSSPFYCFLSLALASRHVNCLLAQLQPCQIHLPSNTRLLLGQCAARGLLHSPIPLIGPANSSSNSSILLPHTEYASNILDISIVLNKDFLQERLELVRYVRRLSTFAASRASLYENGVDGTSRASSHVISFFCEET